MSRVRRVCNIAAAFSGVSLRRSLRVKFTRASPGLGDSGDGVFEDQLFLGTGFEKDGKLVKASDPAGKLGAVQEINNH